MILGAPPEIPTPYHRSAFQVALLFFATGGIYIFVWSFYVRRWCAATLEKTDQPLWKSIALIVPIFNLFLLFDLGHLIKGVAWRAKLPQANWPLPWFGIYAFVIGALWRLPDPYWFVSIFEFVPFAFLQSVLIRSEMVAAGESATPTKLHWIEWIIIVVGCTMWALAAAAAMLPDANGMPARLPWFPAAIYVLATVVLAVVWQKSRRVAVRSGATPADRL